MFLTKFISKIVINFCSEKVDIPRDQVIDNLQDLTSRYEGTTYAQQCFVNLKTRELIKKWVDAKSNANDNKKWFCTPSSCTYQIEQVFTTTSNICQIT